MLLCGDSLALLRAMPSDSLDALVTDPPAGISFMGKAWDSDKGGRDAWIQWMTDVMAECLRVLKPGAHGLVWALPRTSHWTATALENAGFEVRDVVNHIFGTGFPKSLNIGKAIDKAAGRYVPGDVLPSSRNSSASVTDIATSFREKTGTNPQTPEAKQWDGWGTALKPAHEHWILVRRPLGEKTVAANVLKHGTGGINVDGCRIGTDLVESGRANRTECESESYGTGLMGTEKTFSQGRFPSNLLISEEAAADLDQHSGISVSLDRVRKNNPSPNLAMSGANLGHLSRGHTDTGGASRFFYIAKASRADKGAENTHPTVKSTTLMQYLIKLVTPPGGVVLDPFMGSGSTGVAAHRLGFDFLGIEQQKEYFEVAISRVLKGPGISGCEP